MEVVEEEREIDRKWKLKVRRESLKEKVLGRRKDARSGLCERWRLGEEGRGKERKIKL